MIYCPICGDVITPDEPTERMTNEDALPGDPPTYLVHRECVAYPDE